MPGAHCMLQNKAVVRIFSFNKNKRLLAVENRDCDKNYLVLLLQYKKGVDLLQFDKVGEHW